MEEIILDNGLKILVEERENILKNYLSLGVKYGYAHDKIEKMGLAHFLEHYLSPGTFHMYSWVSDYITIYTIECMPKYYKSKLEFMWKSLFKPKFTLSKHETIRKEIFNEKGEGIDNLDEYTELLLSGMLYPDTPHGLPVEGTDISLQSIQLEDLVEAYHGYYVPENMCISLITRKKEKSLPQIIEKFKSLEPKEVQTSPQYSVKKIRKKFYIESRNLHQAYLRIGFRIPRTENLSDLVALSLISTLHENRVYKAIREKSGEAYTIITNYSDSEFGVFSTLISCDGKNIKKNLKIVLEEIENIKCGKFSKEEFKIAKILEIESIGEIYDNIKMGLIFNLFRGLGLINYTIKDKIKTIETLTSQNIIHTANKYLKEDEKAIVVIKPKENSGF